MSSFQPGTDKSTELNPPTSGVVGEAAANLANAAEELSCDKLSPRLDDASRALRGDSPTSAGVTTAQKTSLEIAKEMVDSYEFNQSTGVSTFTVPAGVTDVDALKVLNEYFRKNHHTFNRDAVYAAQLEWFEKCPPNQRALFVHLGYLDGVVDIRDHAEAGRGPARRDSRPAGRLCGRCTGEQIGRAHV